MLHFWQEVVNHEEDLKAHRELYAEVTRSYAYYQTIGDHKRAMARLEEIAWRAREIQRLERIVERKQAARQKAREFMAGA
ncbi:hypothetical protein [Desmospora activa]|uniref:Uncharacterized protein n=1 Tax=Desmospora activa DSM 45169 TaxID=1121389 RepID=A0A2T4Z8Z6_9BACL|nr:hypothetical protein [Desmospora activa]PTM58350.1 hypothetical protein C8J48_0932 [Desmospora activa DSM 45169]